MKFDVKKLHLASKTLTVINKKTGQEDTIDATLMEQVNRKINRQTLEKVKKQHLSAAKKKQAKRLDEKSYKNIDFDD
jgi:NADPH-dependent 7-cyano-7-deazaguanine reductase QueF-like protein